MTRSRFATTTLLALHTVLVAMVVGAAFVQVVMVPLLVVDVDEAGGGRGLQVVLASITVLVPLAVQVTAVCVWRLLTMVRRGTLFSPAAFPYVDIMTGAVAAAAVLVFGYAVALAPGQEVAPGVVLLICGVSLAIGGLALLVLVMRQLLAQAMARDTEARALRAELATVI